MSEEKKGFFTRLKEGLTKTRNNIVSGIDSVFSGFSSIDDDFYEELEEILIMGDIGVRATNDIIERLKEQVKQQHIKEPAQCKQLLHRLLAIMDEKKDSLRFYQLGNSFHSKVEHVGVRSGYQPDDVLML